LGGRSMPLEFGRISLEVSHKKIKYAEPLPILEGS
jgi:hypothetical protein